ncbi:transcription initiation factor TFIID subunit 7-like isoform X3 [Phoenix dactylifera]|uniref:Transcription initiation factor TFIID subunit 7-like isoform X3 n=1 Tax=Phoenix dactylifera TaxID=42345 RepID=A0A8B7CZK9_PHODC|nr:transcription initiation factor TFIID subunit 7-like isoform X3 [Phoenix dactylifera]
MEEQFILRVPPSVSERIERLFNENASSSEDGSLDLSFSEDGRSGTFMIGNERFPASLLDLPCIVESYKTYDDSVLIKTADIGQPELVQRVEKDLLNIMSGGTVESLHVEMVGPEAGGERKKDAPTPVAKPEDVPLEVATNGGGERERGDSDDSLEPES